MIIEGKSDKERLDFFQQLYDEAEGESAALMEKQKKYYEQYKGSAEIDGSDVPAKQVRNITYELIESQVTSYIPNPAVTPKVYSVNNERCAKSIETLLKNKRDELPFEKMNDMDERYSPIYGGSVWLIEWDESIKTHSTVGDVRVSCLSPRKFMGQPGIFEIQDMEYCFIRFETTKEEIVRKYDISPADLYDTESEENSQYDKTATLYVCYYRNDEGKVCQFVWSGDVVLLDIDDYYSRKKKVCGLCGRREELCTCEKPKLELLNDEYEELTRDIVRSDGSIIPAQSMVMENGMPVMVTEQRQMQEDDGSLAFEPMPDGSVIPVMSEIQVPKVESTRLPYYEMSMLPIVIRKNTSEEDSLWGQSDCEFIRPQQQGINKLESRIQEKVLGGGVFPILPEGFDVELDNSIFKKVFRVPKNEVGKIDRLDLQVNVSVDTAQSERLYDHAKRIVGVTDSFQGQHDASAQSGKAKQLQIQQAAGRLDSKRRMKNAAYAEMDQIIFQYYLAYADEPRPASFKNSHGVWENVMFNRYDFIERDEAGEYYYNDAFLFAADASMDVERDRATLWAENRQNLASGAYGDPNLPETKLIYWQIQERLHYPYSRDIVEKLQDEIARQMAQMQAQMGQMQQENAMLAGDLRQREGYEDYLKGKIQESGRGALA